MVGNIFKRKYAFIFFVLPSCLHVMAVLFFSSCDWLDCKLPSDRPYYHEQMVSRDLCSNAHKHVWPISNVLSHSLRDKKQKNNKKCKICLTHLNFSPAKILASSKSLKSSYGRLKRQAMKMNSTSTDRAFLLNSRKKMWDSSKSPKLAKYVKTVCHVNGFLLYILNYIFLS